MKVDILEGLNEEQKEAITSTEGYIRVIAGAGSGKTKALVSRYVYLVNEVGISTANILCITFTNKAAKEMKKRIRNIIGDNDTGLVCTFHGFCRYMLKEDIHAINYPSNFNILDSEDVESIFKIVYEQGNISSREINHKKAKDIIGLRKKNKRYISYILESDSNKVKEKFLSAKNIEDKIFFGYLYQQRKNFGLDYNDLIMFALYILEEDEEIRLKWQKRLEYIMVDEFQDVSGAQYNLVSILSEYHKNLFIVGDPDQTIYSWRGARVEYILNFDKEFKDAKTIMMNTNYRSNENILRASNSLIDKNEIRIKKALKGKKDIGVLTKYNHADNTIEEAKWISDEISTLIEKGAKYSDIAILYRAHYVSRSIEEIFIQRKIPYILYSGVNFYERKEIKDVLSYLKMIIFEDDLSFVRIINEPKRNFGKKRMKIIQDYAEVNNCTLFNALKCNIDDKLITNSKANEFIRLIEKYQKIYREMTITDLLMAILSDSGYEAMLRESGEDDRLDNLSELKNSILEYEINAGEETDLQDYLQTIALYTNTDVKEEKEKIQMMTLHTSKGLEFPYVFICGLNEGIFPSKRANTKKKLEEERRLAYVGYTRAEEALFLSDAAGKNYDQSFRYPSRFIFNTDRKFLNYIVELDKDLIDEANKNITISEEKMNSVENIKFKVGEKIIHSIFGVGVIKDINRENSSYIIKFDKSETDRNISFATKLQNYRGVKDSEDEKEIETYDKKIEKKNILLKEELEKLRKENEEYIRRIKISDEGALELKQKIENENILLRENEEKLKEEIYNLKKDNLEYINKNEMLEKSNSNLKEKVEELKQYKLRSKERVKKLKEKLKLEIEDNEESKIVRLEVELEKLKSDKLENDKRCEVLESINSNLKEELKKLEKYKSSADDKIRELEDENVRLDTKNKIITSIREYENKLRKNKSKLFGRNSKDNKRLSEEIRELSIKLRQYD